MPVDETVIATEIIEELPKSLERRHVLGAVLLVVSVAAVLYFSGLADLTTIQRFVDRLRALSVHPWFPAAFLGAYLLFNLFLLPLAPLSVLAVVVWGWKIGGGIELLANIICCIPPYFIARSAGAAFVLRAIERRSAWGAEKLRSEGLTAVFLLRLVPVLPFPVLSYLAGFAALPFYRYVLLSALGAIPSVFIFAYLVDAVGSGLLSWRDASIRIGIAGAAIAGMYLLARLLLPKLSKKRH